MMSNFAFHDYICYGHHMIDAIALLKSKIEGGSLREYAASIKCSPAYLSDILHGRRTPGPKVLKALGLDREIETIVTYKRRRA